MNFKQKLFYLSCFVALIGLTACEEDLADINVDPLAATSVDASLLFPEILVNFSSSRTIELNAVNIQAQHWTSGGSAGVFFNPERYALSIFTTGNTWANYYAVSLKNLFLVRDLTETNTPEDLNIIGQSRVMEAFIYFNLTTIWEDVPFSEAINGQDFPAPNFDTQEQVLNGVVALCNEAIPLLQAGGSDAITDADLIYGGDTDLWIRFANTIRLKALMLIANVDPGTAAPQIAQVATQPLIMDNSQEAKFDWNTSVGNESPIWRTLDRFAGGTNVFWFSGSTLVDLMNGLNDPRRATYFDTNDDGVFAGQDQGVLNSDNISPVSLNIIRPEMPDRYATASETFLLLADAAVNGFVPGGQAQANTYLQQGVQASLDFYDTQPGTIDAADKAAYLASLPDITGLSAANALQVINEQQYIALFTQGVEAWTHWRRTKVPDFQLPDQALLPDIIRRYSYPPDEAGSNPNIPIQAPLQTPMWFEN